MQPTDPIPYRFSDPREERIHRRLLLIGGGPAAFYRDACRHMSLQPGFEASTHLVCHLLREIESAMRDVLEPPGSHSKPGEGASGSKHEHEVRAILDHLDVPEGDPVAVAWLGLTGQNNDYGLSARAHRDALGTPRPIDDEFRRFWNEIQAVLDAVLDRFEARYLEFQGQVDELLAKTTPTRADARALKNRIPNNLVAFGYFFERLSDPAWLEPLRSEGFFKHPPPPERDSDSGGVRYPPWPESRFLAKMAVQQPEAILEIILGVPETENWSVHLDLVDAALAMPPGVAAKLVPRVESWIGAAFHSLVPDKVGALVAHLARGGHAHEALDLAKSLLALERGREPQSSGSEPEVLASEPTASFGDWEYEQVLLRQFPALVDAVGVEALILLYDLLETAAGVGTGSPSGDAGDDLSYVWRPAIEDSDQNLGRGTRDSLVVAIREASKKIVANDPAALPLVIDCLERRQSTIFRRLALYLLAEGPDEAKALAEERLTDRALFDDITVRHEYARLSQARFGSLSDTSQETILGWISEGPENGEGGATRASGEDAKRRRKGWLINRLTPISDHLPPEWRKRYDNIVAELGRPEHPDFPLYMTGPEAVNTTVLGTDKIRSMEVGEILHLLISWEPSGGFLDPSKEDLARELESAVADDPDRFVAHTDSLQGVDPVYIRGFVIGLEEAAKANKPLRWVEILKFCEWVVCQDLHEESEREQSWRWTRQSTARLLSRGFVKGVSEIPIELRDSAWRVVEPLTTDPDPRLEDEEAYSSTGDPYVAAINSVRGEAMEAVVQYALWLRRHRDAWTGEGKATLQGFGEMPEVRRVLEVHLNSELDPSRAIRSIYGRFFPWIVRLDRGWAAANVSRIFSTDESGDAAWRTYVTICPPDDETFNLLREEYDRAVDRLKPDPAEGRQYIDDDRKLGEHLMVFYSRGRLDLNDPDGVLARYFARASGSLRSDALGFIGRSIHNTEGDLPPRIVKRLEALWGTRLESARSATADQGYSSELAAFGWWFVSEKLDETWSVAQLKEALRIAKSVATDHRVVERLATLAPAMTLDAVECLRLLVDGDREGWHIGLWKEHARTILSIAIGSANEAARDEAISLINRLSARGFLEFGDLLPGDRSVD